MQFFLSVESSILATVLAYPPSKLYKIMEAELFWPLIEDGLLQERAVAEEPFHRIAQHFPPLAERLFDNVLEEPFITWQLLFGFPCQPDDRRLHFGRWGELAFVNAKEVFA